MIQKAAAAATYVGRNGYGQFPVNTGDWTVLFRFLYPSTPSGGNIANLFNLFKTNLSYAEAYVFVGSDPDTSDVYLDVSNGTTEQFTSSTAITNTAQNWAAVTYAATTHLFTLILNGASIGTVTVDMSAVVFSALTLLGVTDASAAASVAYSRAFSRILSGAELTAEVASVTAVSTTGLIWDCPLQASIDLTSHNNTLNQLAATGTITTDTTDPLINVIAGPPTNIDPNTAMTVTTASAIFQDTLTTGAATKVWFKIVAMTTGVMGGDVWGGGGTYLPFLRVYEGLANALDDDILLGMIAAQCVPVQFPVTQGLVYYISIDRNAAVSPATLQLSMLDAPNLSVPIGSIAIPDDTSGFPLALVSGVQDYANLKFYNPFPAGEGGDTLTTGIAAVEDIDTNGVTVFNALYQSIAAQSGLSTTHVWVRTCTGAGLFYVGASANPSRFYTLSATGILSAATVLTGIPSMSAGAASNDQTTFYHAVLGATVAVHTWNITGNVAGADLAAAVSNYSVTDILVLADDTILVAYYKTTVARDQFVRRYNAAGSILNTYSFAVPLGSSAPRLASALDDPASFWIFIHPASTPGIQQFVNVKASDGSVLTTRNNLQFEAGVFLGASTALPLGRFGASGSCPFWMVRILPIPPPTTQVFPIRRERRFLLPSSDSNHRMQIPTIELLMRTGIGLKPDAWDTDANVPFGANPKVMFRLSKDGGETWGPERTVTAGEIGQYLRRVRLLQATGNYRNAVLEVTVDAPVDWQFLSALAPSIVEGSS